MNRKFSLARSINTDNYFLSSRLYSFFGHLGHNEEFVQTEDCSSYGPDILSQCSRCKPSVDIYAPSSSISRCLFNGSRKFVKVSAAYCEDQLMTIEECTEVIAPQLVANVRK